MPPDIPWGNVIIALLSSTSILGAYLTYKAQTAKARSDSELQAKTAELNARTAEVNAKVTRAKNEDDADLSYVKEQRARITELEQRLDAYEREFRAVDQKATRSEFMALEMARLARDYAKQLNIELDHRIELILVGNDATPAGTVMVPGSPPQVVSVTPVTAEVPDPVPQPVVSPPVRGALH